MQYVIKLLSTTFLYTFVFSLVNAMFFILLSDTITRNLIKIKFMTVDSSEIAVGGISAAISIIIATTLRVHVFQRYELNENPLLDGVGIIFSTILIIAVYTLWNQKNRKKEKKEEE